MFAVHSILPPMAFSLACLHRAEIQALVIRSSLKTVDASGSVAAVSPAVSPARSAVNNYHRPEGQNVGNFLTERPVSRVLNVPGGSSQIVFGSEEAAAAVKAVEAAKVGTWLHSH